MAETRTNLMFVETEATHGMKIFKTKSFLRGILILAKVLSQLLSTSTLMANELMKQRSTMPNGKYLCLTEG